MNYDELNQSFQRLNLFVEREEGKRQILEEQLYQLNQSMANEQEREILLESVVLLFQRVADYARTQAKSQIEDLVTKCLQFILENDIEFIVEFSESRGLPSASFYTKSNYESYSVKTRPELSKGGGIVDIISIALRIAFLEIHKPRLEGPLFLDEPGKHVSNDYIYNLGEFLRECSVLFDRQIIMVTHNDYLAQICDSSFKVIIKNGISQVEKIPIDSSH
ncbi:ATPase [Peptoniphilus sp. KCTC 25270]|uniref:ATPase n=1 Tax=Peptoniphilus sp. KCTC 25270 TaxID=2897414 RepID=UPI001E5BE09E|nr:ATPase [Peptoniphilus sp. KCTC 25270]MCD1147005.1 ATPase [Peptoniphilus sp. KCTC 25270]